MLTSVLVPVLRYGEPIVAILSAAMLVKLRLPVPAFVERRFHDVKVLYDRRRSNLADRGCFPRDPGHRQPFSAPPLTGAKGRWKRRMQYTNAAGPTQRKG